MSRIENMSEARQPTFKYECHTDYSDVDLYCHCPKVGVRLILEVFLETKAARKGPE